MKYDYLKEHSDNELMNLIAQGKWQGFEELFIRYNTTLITYCSRPMGGDRLRAEDLAQEIWMKIVSRAHLYDCSRPFKPWLLTVAKNKAISNVTGITRRRKISNQRGDEIENEMYSTDSKKSVEEFYVEKESQNLISASMAELPKNQMISLIAWLENPNYCKDLSKKFGISRTAVHQIISRAKKNLKKIIKKRSLVEEISIFI